MSQTYPNHSFEIDKRIGAAKRGRIVTPHGVIETPNYIFCATRGAIRCATPDQMVEAGAQIILSNTYHMMISPGPEVVEKLGGLHKMIGWDGPMLTDSGGFQIFALGAGTDTDEIKARAKGGKTKHILKITEEGAQFRSYLDGSKQVLTPERAMDIQRSLGADLLMPLDEFMPSRTSYADTALSMERSHRWEMRSLEHFKKSNDGKQALYGIIQGGVYEDLRRKSADFTRENDFFGTAIGGSLGVTVDQVYDEAVKWSMENAHPDRPVHLLGIGSFRDVFSGVRMGVDTFDCVTPTRVARHGWALLKGAEKERLNILNAKFKDDPTPLDPNSDFSASKFSRGYVHHLFKANEPLAAHILSRHNVNVICTLMREVRAALETDTLDALEKEWLVS